MNTLDSISTKVPTIVLSSTKIKEAEKSLPVSLKYLKS